MAVAVAMLSALPIDAAVSADSTTKLSVDIAPQSLESALVELSRQGHLQLVIATRALPEKMSAALRGSMPLGLAFDHLLKDTGLTYRLVGDHTIAIVKADELSRRSFDPPDSPGAAGVTSPGSAQSDDKVAEGASNNRAGKGDEPVTQRSLIVRLATFFGVCVSSASGPACAENAAAESRQLEEVVVTAQRREERLQDVPLTVVAMSDEQLQKSGVTNIFDLQSVVSGLTYSGVGNSTQPAIRGLSTMVSTNGSENPNALYIDGVYYATNQLLGANLPDVDRVEVLKGPQGTLFGRNSVGGAIRIFTKDPTFTPTGDFTVDAGYYTGSGTSRSNPHTAARGFFSMPLIDDTLAVSLSGGYDTTDGFMTDDATGDKYGDIRRSNARTKLLWQPTDSIRAVLSAYYLKHNDEGLQSATPLDGHVTAALFPGSIVPTQPYHTAYDSGQGVDINTATVENYGFGANVQFDLGDIGTLTSITDWNDNDIVNLTTFSHSKGSATCVTTFACVDYSYFFKLKALSQELNFVSEQFGMFRATAGLFYYHQNSTTDAYLQQTVVPGGRFLKSENFKIDSTAVYGELEMQPTDALTFTVGGRYTHEPHEDRSTGLAPKKVTFDSFIPRVSVRYAFTPRLNAYATYSVGEKSGLSGIANTASIPPFAPVDPEENHAYELGLKYGSPGFTFNLSGFYYDYKNKQEQGFTGTNVFLLNSGPVRIQGVDFDTSVRLGQDFTLRANAAWVPEAEYRDFPNAVGYALNANGLTVRLATSATDLRLVKAPELTANATLDYVHALNSGSIDASMNVSYSSTVYHDIFHVMKQSPYTTLNSRVGYTFGDDGVHLSLYGRNLGNKAYIANGFSSGQGFTVAYARPREIGLSLNYGF